MPDTYEHNEVHYPKYQNPDESFLKIELDMFRYFFTEFCKFFKCSEYKFSIDEEKIIQMLIRTDQRKVHYLMYHNGTRMDEMKETASICFWLIKYKPLTYNNGKFYSTGDWNEKFAIYFLLSVLAHQKVRSVSAKFIDDIFYTLCNRMISYDSLTILFEALVA